MESIRVPNLSEIRKTSKMYIDRPATLLEVISLRGGPDNPDRTKLLMDSLGKLARHQDDGNVALTVSDLYDMVKDFTMAMIVQTADRQDVMKYSSNIPYFRIRENKFLRTVGTIENDLTKELKRESKMLTDMSNKHQKLMKDLQKAQTNYWKSHSKVRKYETMVKTAQASRAIMADKLAQCKLKATDKTIMELQRTLRGKVEREARDTMAFFKLLSQVDRTRDDMTKLSQNLIYKITFDLADRMESALFTLKDLTETYLPTESGRLLLERIPKVDILRIVAAMVSQNEMVYRCPDVRGFISENGLKTPIPIGTVSYGSSDKDGK